MITMRTDARPAFTNNARRQRGASSPADDQGILRCASVMLALGEAVGAIFVLKIAIDFLSLNY
jgi:hypothetical protein